MRARVAFIDFEASGLGARSWPVEAGWAMIDGRSEGVLIRPAPGWPDEAWDPLAERLHGITRAMLEVQGAPVAEVCRRLDEALAGADVYSDAPDWDGFWLMRLYEAAGARPAFRLKDFGRLMRPLVAGREARLFDQADRIAPRRHRAEADARHLQTLYALALAA